MNRKLFFIILACWLISGQLFAVNQTHPVKIENVIEDPYHYENSNVTLEGVVFQYIDKIENSEDAPNASNSKYYILKGDWGGSIKIQTTRLPEINQRVRVTGFFFIDKESKPCLNQSDIQIIIVDPPTTHPPISLSSRTWFYYLIIAAVLLLILMIILTFLLVRSKKQSFHWNTHPNGFTNASPDPMIIEGSTIKMAMPPAGTLKLLPGRFEVTRGDDTIKEIRFYKTKKGDADEITFGRGTGPAYSHIQLKPMTVSVRQAKLLWKNGNYTLTNWTDTNPTSVDGLPLGKNESVILADGQKIEMGEVMFIFHAK